MAGLLSLEDMLNTLVPPSEFPFSKRFVVWDRDEHSTGFPLRIHNLCFAYSEFSTLDRSSLGKTRGPLPKVVPIENIGVLSESSGLLR
jgi:hypothetical protein